ncbi:MAG: hypothetical protein WBF35_13865 [Candidatus Acidiferrales bacterium]
MSEAGGKKTDDEMRRARNAAGLCADCRHAQKIISDRGANFYLCELSFSNPSFAKYPTLPVRSCTGCESDLDRD